MIARVFSGRDKVPATVEQIGVDKISGCIIRWDFTPIMHIVPKSEFDEYSHGRRAGGSRAEAPSVEDDEPVQTVEVDSGTVAFSEVRYVGVPDPETVVADIQKDLNLRYGEGDRPEIDLDSYRSAIATLK